MDIPHAGIPTITVERKNLRYNSNVFLSSMARKMREVVKSEVFLKASAFDVLRMVNYQIDSDAFYSIVESMTMQNFLERVDENSLKFCSFDKMVVPDGDSDSSECDVSLLEVKLDKSILPTGVFPSLSLCYTPTCDQHCYSSTCMKFKRGDRLPRKTNSKASSLPYIERQPHSLWSDHVESSILLSIGAQERKRQELIHELICTESDFVSDLNTLKSIYLERLLTSNIIPMLKRDEFCSKVFGNLDEVIRKNYILLDSLLERQSLNVVIPAIGDIFDNWTLTLDTYMNYGENQAFAKLVLDMEMRENLVFRAFCEANERLPESRKLPLQSFLNSPTTRLGRYPLFLQSIFNKTSDDREKGLLSVSLDRIKLALSEVNGRSGAALNRIKVKTLHDSLMQKAAPHPLLSLQSIDINHPSRKLIREGSLRRRKLTGDLQDVEVVLLDNYLIISKKKTASTTVRLQIKKYPIPLYLLRFSAPSTADQDGSGSTAGHETELEVETLGKYAVKWVFVGSPASLSQWKLSIIQARETQFSHMKHFKLNYILSRSFDAESILAHRILSSIVLERNFVLLGCSDGLYCRMTENSIRRVLSMGNIFQMQQIPELDLLVFLSEKMLFIANLNAVRPWVKDFSGDVKIEQVVGSVSFFEVGKISNEWTLITARSKVISTRIKIFSLTREPDIMKRRNSFQKLIQKLKNNVSSLELKKSVYIPAESFSVKLIDQKLCIGCTHGFELIDITSLRTQALLDSNDYSLTFVLEKENVHPMAVFRVSNSEFLLCYEEFGVYVDKHGRNSRSPIDPSKISPICWLVTPLAFHCVQTEVLVFGRSLIEIRDAVSSDILQVIQLQDIIVTDRGENVTFISCQFDASIWKAIVNTSWFVGTEVCFTEGAVSDSHSSVSVLFSLEKVQNFGQAISNHSFIDGNSLSRLKVVELHRQNSESGSLDSSDSVSQL